MYEVSLVSLRLVREKSLTDPRRQLNGAGQAYEFLRGIIADRDREVVVVLCLDTKNRLVCVNEAFVGTINQSLTNPREIFKGALLSNAASIILAHNHPSGDPTPSADDEHITQAVKQAGETLCIRLLDHIIVGDGTFYSFAEDNRL
jgi:DNA repair protein RadC